MELVSKSPKRSLSKTTFFLCVKKLDINTPLLPPLLSISKDTELIILQ